MNISIPKVQEPIFSRNVFCFVDKERVPFTGTWNAEQMIFDVPDNVTFTIKARREFEKQTKKQNRPQRKPCCSERKYRPQISAAPQWGQPIHTTKGISIEVAHGCNLQCQQCSHYCNFGRKGYTPTDTVIYTLSEWSKRLNPTSICITGGECFLHPELPKIITETRKYFPQTRIRVYTNGTMLAGRIDEVKDVIKETQSTLVISVKNYQKICRRDWIDTVRKGIQAANENNLPVELRNHSWTTVQAGTTENGKPAAFHGTTEIGWNNCPTRRCARFVYQDKIWNCPPAFIAYQMRKEGTLDAAEWSNMLSAPVATVLFSRDDLLQFFNHKPCVCCQNCRQSITTLTGHNLEFPKGCTKNYILNK
jgi:organic radical activating enzyme